MRRSLAVLCCLMAMTSAVPAHAAPTAFRISSMYVRDPHFFVNFIGCRDVTDNALAGFSFNGSIQTSIQTDGNGDGRLDLNYILIFDPLDQSAVNTPFSFESGECNAPMAGTSCWPGSSPAVLSTSTNNLASACLGSIVGTTHGYTPAVTLASAPCFSAALGTVTLNLAGIPVTLQDTYIAATYVGNPAASLTNGLIRGFISETDANNTIIPNSMPLFGGQPLSSLFPGGTNCCAASSDKDTNNGVVGWYMYLNFSATQVPWYDHPVAVGNTTPLLTLDAPHPNPFNPSTEIRYVLPRATRVQIRIYDASGRMVSELENGDQMQGDHSVHWNGRDARGGVVSSGVYFVRLAANGETRTQKMVLLK